MSFSSEQKSYVMNLQYKSSCCRRALLTGALLAKGVAFEEQIEISVELRETADFLSRFISEFYGAKPEISTATVGGRRVVISFKSKSASKYLSDLSIDKLFLSKCDDCLSSFLRGVFLACGRMSDPKSQYSLEFSLGDRCRLMQEYFSKIGLTPRISEKENEMVVYFKNSADIEDFCGLAGLNRALFILMDAKVEGEIRKNAMRVANCETNNIIRAVNAAKPQLLVIRALEENDLLSVLPDELEITARLRLEYPDLSLSQLAAIAVPAISKPGLSHRLNKIVEISENLLKNKK